MKRIATVMVGLALLLLPGSALAASGSSTCQAYNPQLCPSVTPTTSVSSAQTLPFTGLDVVLLAAGGGTLLGTGLLVRRLSRHLS